MSNIKAAENLFNQLDYEYLYGIARQFARSENDKYSYIFVHNKLAMATDGHRIVAVKTDREDGVYARYGYGPDSECTEDYLINYKEIPALAKHLAPKTGNKISLKIPLMNITEDVTEGQISTEDYSFAHVIVAVTKRGQMIILDTLLKESRESIIAIINLGLLSPLEGETVDLYFRGRYESIYFEIPSGHIYGTIMPQKFPWDPSCVNT